jgi:hypothetical protein
MKEDFIMECECGQKWNMDEEPTPDTCLDTVWENLAWRRSRYLGRPRW